MFHTVLHNVEIISMRSENMQMKKEKAIFFFFEMFVQSPGLQYSKYVKEQTGR